MKFIAFFVGDFMINETIFTFDEIHKLSNVIFQNMLEIEDTETRIKAVEDDVLSILIDAYVQGVNEVSLMLGWKASVNDDEMHNAIYRTIEGETFEDRVIRYVETLDQQGLQKLIDSEYHRVFNESLFNGAVEFKKETLKSVKKRWCTLLDDRVRDTHSYLEGTEVSLYSEFYTYDGDHALFPGNFQKAYNNVNCRCYLQYITG